MPQCHQVLCSHCRKHLWPSLRLWHHLKALLLQTFNKHQACYFCLLIIDTTHPPPLPHTYLSLSHTQTHTQGGMSYFSKKKNIAFIIFLLGKLLYQGSGFHHPPLLSPPVWFTVPHALCTPQGLLRSPLWFGSGYSHCLKCNFHSPCLHQSRKERL